MHKQKGAPSAKPTITVATIAVASAFTKKSATMPITQIIPMLAPNKRCRLRRWAIGGTKIVQGMPTIGKRATQVVIACELTPPSVRIAGSQATRLKKRIDCTPKRPVIHQVRGCFKRCWLIRLAGCRRSTRRSGAFFVDLIMQRAAIQRRSAIAAKGTTIVKTVRQSEEAATSAELNPAMPPAKTLMVVV